MESTEKHTSTAQPIPGTLSSEQYGQSAEAETLPYLLPGGGFATPLPPGYPQLSDVTQPGAVLPSDTNAANPPAPAKARKRSWKTYAAGVAVLLLLMLASFGVGSALVSHPSGTAGTSGSSSSVTLPASVTDLQQTIIEVTNQVQPSVVEVTSVGQNGEAIGSGVILTSDGYIATNDHVVDGYSTFTVRLSNG